MHTQFPLTFVSVILICGACSSTQSPPAGDASNLQAKNAEPQNSQQEDQRGDIESTIPNRATVNEPFLVVLTLIPKTGCGDTKTKEKPASVEVHMANESRVEFKPATFSTIPCKQNYLTVKVKEKGTGIAPLVGYAEGFRVFDQSVDVGFDAKVRLTQAAPLGFDEPGTLNVEIVDQDGKALSFSNTLVVTVESADALLLADKGKWGSSADLDMSPGARSSPPFQIKSQNRYGGSIHLTTSLKMGQIILSQENHSFDVAAATWLPVLSAILGALLYGLYSIATDEKRAKIWEKIAASAVAGAIAWLFAGFDILGLKLDTHSLRTFAITGFLFAFLGVDVLLSKKFPRTVQVAKE